MPQDQVSEKGKVPPSATVVTLLEHIVHQIASSKDEIKLAIAV